MSTLMGILLLMIIFILLGIISTSIFLIIINYFTHKSEAKDCKKFTKGNFKDFKLLAKKYNLLKYYKYSSILGFSEYGNSCYENNYKNTVMYEKDEIIFNKVGFMAYNIIEFIKIDLYMQIQSYLIRVGKNIEKEISIDKLKGED